MLLREAAAGSQNQNANADDPCAQKSALRPGIVARIGLSKSRSNGAEGFEAYGQERLLVVIVVVVHDNLSANFTPGKIHGMKIHVAGSLADGA